MCSKHIQTVPRWEFLSTGLPGPTCSSHRMRWIFFFYRRALLITKINNVPLFWVGMTRRSYECLKLDFVTYNFRCFFFLRKSQKWASTFLSFTDILDLLPNSLAGGVGRWFHEGWRSAGCCPYPGTSPCPEGLLAGTLWPSLYVSTLSGCECSWSGGKLEVLRANFPEAASTHEGWRWGGWNLSFLPESPQEMEGSSPRC